MNAIVPIPKIDVNVREATLDDVPFIDALQREHQRQVGFLARSWIENKIKAGQVLVAEEPPPLPSPASGGGLGGGRAVGYVISQDKYLKREELGLIVQLCVAKGVQRNLIGATLLKSAFEWAAYGCRLFCLWCAQDIAANRFWEAMGFVPLAYRAGSEKKARVHIFWQKRIRQGDETTPWWFPSSTGGGAMREDRIVLPIPPGKHWSDELPVLLPPDVARAGGASRPRLLEGKKTAGGTPAPRGRMRVAVGRSNTLHFTPPAPVKPLKAEKAKREKKPKQKNDPKLVAAARELRDRWLEHVNSGQAGETLIEHAGKYDVSRALPEAPIKPMPLLPAA